MQLTDFLLARIAEDDAAARRLLRYAQENELAVGEPQMLGRRIPGWHEWPEVQAMCSHMLARCVADRQIVEECSDATSPEFEGDYDLAPLFNLGDIVLRALAGPYADHPDYRAEWAL